jgi:hypothetical protein
MLGPHLRGTVSNAPAALWLAKPAAGIELVGVQIPKALPIVRSEQVCVMLPLVFNTALPPSRVHSVSSA